MQNVKVAGPSELKVARDLAGSWDGASGAETELRRSVRSQNTDDRKAKKRKVGRPIAYCGDINSPYLTPTERRQYLRRIANRESARRVRARHRDLLDDMTLKVKEMEEAKLRLQQQLASTENKHSVMMDEVQTIDRHMCAKITENKVLQAKVQKLRKYLTAGEGRALKAPGHQVATSDCGVSGGLTPSAAELSPAPGVRDNTCGCLSLYCMQCGCMQLPSGNTACGSESGSSFLGFASASPGRGMQLEPIDRSFSNFLEDVFTQLSNEK